MGNYSREPPNRSAMKLRVPVDVMILQVISDGQHANPVRVRYLIEAKHRRRLGSIFDRDRIWTLDYITQRMGELRERDLLERVPPKDSGLYRITDLGYEVLAQTVDSGSPRFNYREMASTVRKAEMEKIEADDVPWSTLEPHSDD